MYKLYSIIFIDKLLSGMNDNNMKNDPSYSVFLFTL